MPLAKLLRNTAIRTSALRDIEEVFFAVFGYGVGSEPNVYADYDLCCELMGKMRRAIDDLRVS